MLTTTWLGPRSLLWGGPNALHKGAPAARTNKLLQGVPSPPLPQLYEVSSSSLALR